MSDQRKLALGAVALSAVVVAVCVLALTIQAMASGFGGARVLDQEALERQVAGYVRSEPSASRDGVACPVSIEAEEGNKFTCEVVNGGGTEKVSVTVTSDQGELAMGYAS